MKKSVKKNIVTLFHGLSTLPRGYRPFGMGVFYDVKVVGGCYSHTQTAPADILTQQVKHPCGSSACIIGHGPTFGVKPLRSENWTAYAERCFSSSGSLDDDLEDQLLWDFLFSAHWKSYKTGRYSELIEARIRLEYFILSGFSLSTEVATKLSHLHADEISPYRFYSFLRREIKRLKSEGKQITI